MARMRPIRIERWTSAQDGNGDFKESVVKLNRWAEVLDEGGSKSSLNGVTNLTRTKRFRVAYHPGLTVTGNYRVVYDGKRMAVESIEKENEERFHLIITAVSSGKS